MRARDIMTTMVVPERTDTPGHDAEDPLDAVSGVMNHPVVAIVADADLATALRVMSTRGVRHLLVLDAGRHAGLVHETDLLWALCTGPAHHRIAVTTCARRDVPVAAPADRVAEVAARMTAARTDAALVVDGQAVVGIVTATDVLRHLATTQSTLDSQNGVNPG